MRTILLVAISVVLFICVAVLVDALAGFARKSRGIDEDAIDRMLGAVALSRYQESQRIDILLSNGRGSWAWQHLVPSFVFIQRLILQSGTKRSPTELMWIGGGIALATAGAVAFIMPAYLVLLSIPVGLVCGVAPVIFGLMRLRAKRISLFEEQLPDAIDLAVRSLKVGHPMSSAIGVIARELPSPIGPEFAIAADKVSYGMSIPEALGEMQARVPVTDLSYLVVAVQIQEESGGNLVESLGKLSTVIRDRFRMFRKARAITAEGRISAWLLSIFPFVIGCGVLIVKPDYYSQVMDYPHFTGLAVTTAILLVVNIFAMRFLTDLKI